MIKAVSFDLWFTLLWEDNEALKHYQRDRVEALYESFSSKLDISRHDIERYYRSTSHVRMVVSNRDLVKLIALMIGFYPDDDFLDMAVKRYIESTFYWRPYVNEEALDIIPMLKDEYGLRIGILSNTSFSEEGIWKLLENVGLDKYIDIVVSSSDIGYVKPMARAFQFIVDRLGYEAKDIVHIGDTYLDDVIGALSVGMKGVLYTGLWKFYDRYRSAKNRVGEAYNDDLILISSLTELPSYLPNL
jgi:putative hydrolase of the HAD superfamily